MKILVQVKGHRIGEVEVLPGELPLEAADRLIGEKRISCSVADVAWQEVQPSEKSCYNCGNTRSLMGGSLGLLCPDCYDDIEGDL